METEKKELIKVLFIPKENYGLTDTTKYTWGDIFAKIGALQEQARRLKTIESREWYITSNNVENND